jgi:FkbM family methyltransferase
MKSYKFISSFIQKRFARKKKWQHYFYLLHGFSASAMNYGQGSNFKNSGEIEAMKYVKSKLKKANPILFDVGANIGNYTLTLTEIFGTDVTIYSFEPSANTFKRLLENIKTRNNIHAHNIALSNSKGSAELFSTENNSEVASLINLDRTIEKYGSNTVETIQMDTLDNFCLTNSISTIDFLKIDVEGFELTMLQGAANMLNERKIAFIQFEFGVPNIDSRTYFKDFWKLLSTNYTIYRIVQDGLFKIEEYTPSLEIFMTSNFIAELK